ncbi:energy transducer TonB [Solimonas variicoloris]|uniref:energy transducer TonB n=1 Tax=Solimonas variicoloris TaxID=254408 RepID=UPI00037B0D30|nr:energy transducer TonB [Solimonas variicoloris]
MEFGNTQGAGNRRLIGIGGVVVFHALLIWALVSGLARKAIEILPAPIETRIIEEVRPPEDIPPPPPPPTLDIPPPPFVPPPEVNIATPPPRTNTIVAQSTVPTPPPAPAPVVKAPPSVALKIDSRRCRLPEYPAVSQRLGEAGSVVLQLLVGTNGRVTDSKIVTTSGYPRLDEAARKALSLCKFDPAVVEGVPTAAWGTLKYTFKPEQ